VAESEIARKIREGYDRSNDGDYDTLLPLIAEDFELHRRLGGLDDGNVVRGRDEFRRYLEPDVFSVMHNQIVEVRETPGMVLVGSRTTATGAVSGIEMTQMSWHLWEHDGTIAHRVTLFSDQRTAEDAAGLSG
jgi:ketosteroid isomerase-like protein